MTRIFGQISQAYPALASALQSLDEDERPDLAVMSCLGRHVVELFEAGQADSMRPAFALTEQMIVGGPEGHREAAIVGFLETVQNLASHRPFRASAFEPYLGPVSGDAWRELDKAWEGKSTLAEVVAAERGGSSGARWWQFWRRRRRRTPRQMLAQVENPELRKLIEEITRDQ